MTRIFVYGTLLAGEHNHHLLETADFVAAASTRSLYTLHNYGGFPAAVLGGSSAIFGEVYAIDVPTLERLDRLESHPRFYRRTPIVLEQGLSADIYLLRPEQVDGLPIITSGNWRDRT